MHKLYVETLVIRERVDDKSALLYQTITFIKQ